MPKAPRDRLLNPHQVADILGISVTAVRKRLWRGRIPAVKEGREFRVWLSALQAYMKNLPPYVPTEKATDTREDTTA
jgi:excisionase family DNA binding protein